MVTVGIVMGQENPPVCVYNRVSLRCQWDVFKALASK